MISVITGAAGGIGGGIVSTLLARGDRVIAADIRAQSLRELREKLLTTLPNEADAIDANLLLAELDVTKPESWQQLREDSAEHFGPPTVLINNAGISPKHNGVKLQGTDISLQEWESVLAVNLTGAFLGMQTLVPGMQKQRLGRVINISSEAGRVGGRIAGVHYSSTKTALLGLTRGFAWELASDGITVNAVAPGRINLGMAQQTTSEVNEKLLATIPVGRLGTPEDIGRMVAFLSEPDNGFITGATFDVNGGHIML